MTASSVGLRYLSRTWPDCVARRSRHAALNSFVVAAIALAVALLRDLARRLASLRSSTSTPVECRGLTDPGVPLRAAAAPPDLSASPFTSHRVVDILEGSRRFYLEEAARADIQRSYLDLAARRRMGGVR